MEEVDVDHSGYIDFSEFAMASLRKEAMLEREHLEIAFRMFDQDGSGTISADEVRRILLDKVSSEEGSIDELIEMADKNGDGEIDIKEFKDMMIKYF